MALKIPNALYDQLRQHGETTYPLGAAACLWASLTRLAERWL